MAAFLQQTGNFGGVTLAASTTNFYSYGDGSLNNVTTEAPAQTPFRSAGTISLMGIRVSANTLSGSSTLTLRKNGGNGNQTVSIGAGLTGYFEDTVNTDAVVAGDQINYQLTSGTGTSIIFRSIISLFAATTGTVSHYRAGGGHNFTGTSATTFSNIAGGIGFQTTEANTQTKAKTSFTLRNMALYVTSNARTSATTVRSRKNGANGNLLITIPLATTGLFEDTVNSDSLVSGDLFNTTTVLGLGVGGCNTQYISCEVFNSVSPQLQFIAGDEPQAQNSALTRYIAVQGTNNQATTEVSVKTNMTTVLSNLAMFVTANTLNGNTTVTIRKNSLTGYMTLTIPSTTTGYFEDTVNTDLVLPADILNTRIVTGGSSGAFSNSNISMLTNTYTPNHLLACLGAGQ